jgi:hypothetical protein
MALTLDGMLPAASLGGGSSMGSGVGLGAVGGGVAGLVLGSLLASNGNGGLFGGGNNNANVAEFGAINNQLQSLGGQINGTALTAQIRADTIDLSQSISTVGTQIGQLATAQAAANFTTLDSINGLGRDITASQNQNALQQLNSFNNLTTTTLQGFNSSAMQVQNATNQIIAQGTASAAAMAQCCCEIKSTILADGNATRALINDLNVQNLRDQLATANGKVSNNEQNQYLLSTILHHITPTVGSTIV